jgi:charged multivesicular body protein 3
MYILRAKTKKDIESLKKLPQRTPQERRHVYNMAKMLGTAIVGARKQVARLQTGRAQLDSIRMQLEEGIGRQKIQMSMKNATGIMRNVNSLINIRGLEVTMHQLSEELMAAGVIEEMVGDMIPDGETEELEEGTEAEINKVLVQILGPELMKEESPAPELPEPVTQPVEELPSVELEDPAVRLSFLEGRLKALKS